MSGAHSTPLNAAMVKRHKTGTLVDTHPHRGLRLVARDSGLKSWIYRYKADNGRLKQIRIGSCATMSLAEARVELARQKALRKSGVDPRVNAQKAKELRKQEALGAAGPFTFGLMIEAYLQERVEKQRQLKGAKETRRLLERDLTPITNLPVDGVETLQIHELIASIHTRAPDVARVFRRELKAAWEYAMNVGRTKAPCLINRDTGAKMRQGKRDRVLNDEQLAQLIPWMPLHYSQTVADVLLLTLYLGLRSGEVCQMHDREFTVEDEQLWLTIPASRMKKGKDHRVPIVGKALEVVEKNSGAGYLFPSRAGGPIKQKVLGVEVYAHSGRSEAITYKNNSVCPVVNWTPNDLRKTARTVLAKLGCPFEVGESILAHALPGVAGVYNLHSYNDEKLHWLTCLGSYLDALTFRVENVLPVVVVEEESV